MLLTLGWTAVRCTDAFAVSKHAFFFVLNFHVTCHESNMGAVQILRLQTYLLLASPLAERKEHRQAT